ncbi:MAG TPA: ABC transporter permease [Candidatus Acidoferrum sp.]|nr:ABC transporter permease [Candidatus Acidoferrum sp.]
MLNFWKDIQYAFRTLTKNPGFAIVGIVTLALGMAVNTTLFSVINGFLLRPLPVPHAEQITVLALQQSSLPGNHHFSYPDFEELRDQSASFADILAFRVTLAELAVDQKADHCVMSRVSSNYFSSLGVKPAYGRLILPTEGLTPGADPVIVLGYSYWRKRFAGDPDVVGKKVELNQHPFTVIGVAPKDFKGTYSALNMDAFVPFSAQMEMAEDSDNTVEKTWTSRTYRTLTLMGRLKPGISIKQAQASLNVVAQRISDQHPDTEKGIAVQLFPEKLARPEPDPENPIPVAALAFMGLAALVMLVACFNIANVLLVRATVRQREMAIRAALGAGHGRLIRQYLTESLLLAFLGGGAGLLLGSWAAGILGSLRLGSELPIEFDFHPDSTVYLFALAAVLLTGLIVGIMPALRAARTNVITVLHEGGRGSSSGPRRQLARNALVVAQVAGSLVLLIVAGLFVRSLDKAQKINLGFNPDHVLNLSVDVAQIGYQEPRGRAVYRDMESRIRALPGVESVAQAFTAPMSLMSTGDSLVIESHPLEPGQQPPDVNYNMVTTGYFDTLQIPLLRGRKFTDADSEKAPLVAIINQNMAKKFWPNEDALGHRFSIKGPDGPFIEVVGIVHDGKYQDVTEDSQPYFYVPFDQSYMSIRTFHVRTSVPPETLALQLESQIHELAPDVPITQVQTMTESLQGANGFFFFRFGAQITAVMGFLGLILAVVGIYSVVSYAAAQRTQEIGIRVAMGATSRDILKMVLRQGLSVVGIGLALGLVIALAGTRVMSTMIVGVKPSDPLTFTIVVLLLTAIALFACWIPARRATSIDPLVALRHE